MKRITVTLDTVIEQELRKIQGGLIAGRNQDVSFTTTVNVVLLAAMLGADEFSKDTWAKVRKFLDDEQIELDMEGSTDNFLKQLK